MRFFCFLICVGVALSAAADIVWTNVRTMPDDLINTGDGWTASRAEDIGSYRCAADDFILSQATRITKITYYTVPISDPDILGGDYYIYEGRNAETEPIALLFGEDSLPLNRIDTGWYNPYFQTNVIACQMIPTNLVLQPGRYFLAFRSWQTFQHGGGKNGCLTTRWANADTRALWSFDVARDGTIFGPWYTMDTFGGAHDSEWAFQIEGVPEGGPEIYYPNAATTLKGTHTSGDVASLGANDDNYWVQGAQYDPTDPLAVINSALLADTNVGSPIYSAGEIAVVEKTNNLNTTFRLRAVKATGELVTLLDNVPGSSTDVLLTAPIPDPVTLFIDAGNGNRMRLEIRNSASNRLAGFHRHSIDLVKWTLTP